MVTELVADPAVVDEDDEPDIGDGLQPAYVTIGAASPSRGDNRSRY